MASLVYTNVMAVYGTIFAATGPGPGNPTVAGTITAASLTDFSDHVRSLTVNDTVAMQDFTTFGDGGFTTQKPGLIGADIQVEFNQDFASGSVDATFGAAFTNKTLGFWDFKPTNSARGATNPSYVYAAYVASYPVIGQTVGDRAAVTVSLAVTGTYARLTA